VTWRASRLRAGSTPDLHDAFRVSSVYFVGLAGGQDRDARRHGERMRDVIWIRRASVARPARREGHARHKSVMYLVPSRSRR